jgi:hypothetical protein
MQTRVGIEQSAVRPRRRFGRKAVAGLAVFVVAAGVAAFAAFQTEETKGGGAVTSGSLSSKLEGLPLDFKDAQGQQQPLYPTSSDGKDGFVSDTFRATNPNNVPVTYSIYAVCKNTTCTPASDPYVQFQNLYIEVTPQSAAQKAAEAAPSPLPDALHAPAGQVAPSEYVYHGRIADLIQSKAASLGTFTKDEVKTFLVKMWLKQDPAGVQRQNVTSEWDFRFILRNV